MRSDNSLPAPSHCGGTAREHKTIQFEIVQATNPYCWKWIVFLDATSVRTGIALTRADAALDAELASKKRWSSAGFADSRAAAVSRSKLSVPSFPGPEHKLRPVRSLRIWRETAMASNARVFFAGVGTTFVILAIGFGGGLMLAKTAMEPSASSRSIADQLPPVRVILPASAEAAMPPQPPVEPAAAPEPSPPVMAAKEAQQAFEKEKQIERAERRKAEAEERARRKKYAERKARREAARLMNRQQEQQPGILAFGVDGDQSRGGADSFFGN